MACKPRVIMAAGQGTVPAEPSACSDGCEGYEMKGVPLGLGPSSTKGGFGLGRRMGIRKIHLTRLNKKL
jgi:hypothetical protein